VNEQKSGARQFLSREKTIRGLRSDALYTRHFHRRLCQPTISLGEYDAAENQRIQNETVEEGESRFEPPHMKSILACSPISS